jgi:hypothetical protein
MTDRRSRDEERDKPSREEEQQRREDKERREHKERRSDELKESWRRNHPSEPEEDEGDRRGKGRRAWGFETSRRHDFSNQVESLFAPVLTIYTENNEICAQVEDNTKANKCL